MKSVMNTKGAIWRGAGALLVALTLLVTLAPAVSFAGNVDIKDNAGVLSSNDQSSLRSQGSSLPFNVRILTTNSVNSDADLVNQVQSAMSSLGTGLVIGISPKLHYTQVKAQNIGITDAEASDIQKQSNSYFQSSNWRGGFSAMLSRAGQLGNVPASSTTSPGYSPSRSSSNSGFPIWGCLIIGLIALVAFSVFGFGRRRQVNNNNYNAYNNNPGYGGGPGYVPGPGYGPNYGGGYGPNYGGGGGGIGPLGGGAIGAGLGGVVGYELGKEAGRHEGGNYGGNYGGGNYNNNAGGGNWGGNSNDSGTAGGSWDSGNSGGGGDWGGSSSSGSFDTGGGGDWGGGGGGGDFGGGGGDSGGGSW